MKLYFAGPLFTTAERIFNAAVVYQLRSRGHEVFLPQEHPQTPETTSAAGIFNKEVEAIRDGDAIVVCADGPDPDSGTAWELGNAWRDKLSVVFRTDIRDEDDGFPPCNLMLVQSANTFINCKWKSVDEVGEAIDAELRALYDSGAIPKGARNR
jgi:nucleoside 2-deoxyribosyltransferase